MNAATPMAEMTRLEALLIAQQCAQACGCCVTPFEPPEWALAAILAAANGVLADPEANAQPGIGRPPDLQPLAASRAAIDVEI